MERCFPSAAAQTAPAKYPPILLTNLAECGMYINLATARVARPLRLLPTCQSECLSQSGSPKPLKLLLPMIDYSPDYTYHPIELIYPVLFYQTTTLITLKQPLAITIGKCFDCFAPTFSSWLTPDTCII